MCGRDKRGIQRASLIGTQWVLEGLSIVELCLKIPEQRITIQESLTIALLLPLCSHLSFPSQSCLCESVVCLLHPIYFILLVPLGLELEHKKRVDKGQVLLLTAKTAGLATWLTQGSRDRPHWEGCRQRELRASAMNKAFCSQLTSYHFVIFNLDKELSLVLCVCFVSSTGLLLELLF